MWNVVTFVYLKIFYIMLAAWKLLIETQPFLVRRAQRYWIWFFIFGKIENLFAVHKWFHICDERENLCIFASCSMFGKQPVGMSYVVCSMLLSQSPMFRVFLKVNSLFLIVCLNILKSIRVRIRRSNHTKLKKKNPIINWNTNSFAVNSTRKTVTEFIFMLRYFRLQTTFSSNWVVRSSSISIF